jgi:MYXO-CTERM domain-containing protein
MLFPLLFSVLSAARAAPEVCDGLDNDGDGQVDENPVVQFVDADGDGHGDPEQPVAFDTCVPQSGFALLPDDCGDDTAAVQPGATDTCDGRDNDCDGTIDGSCPCDEVANGDSNYVFCGSGGQQRSWTDASGFCSARGYHLVTINDAAEDLFVSSTAGSMSGAQPFYWIGLSNPAGDNTTWIWEDGDPSTYRNWGLSGNPQPNSPAQQCVYVTDYGDGWSDWNCPVPSPFVCEVECIQDAWYADNDGDGFGSGTPTFACARPALSAVRNNDDCDDGDADQNPTATESCNGEDDDCDGSVDEGAASATWYADSDGDGFGDPTNSVDACVQPTGTVSNPDDCDDTNALIRPGAPEVCNGEDDDCDGPADEGLPVDTWFADTDGDGLGDPSDAVTDCAQPSGTVDNADDCDDSDPGIGGVQTWFADTDGDGFGDVFTASIACSAPPGTVADGTDCDDTANTVFPGAPEVCNGADDDCDGPADEGLPVDTWFADDDGDGLGDPSGAVTDCAQPTGTVANADDCDDTDPGVGAGQTWYADTDGDGFGDASTTALACSAPPDFVADDTDCDDTSDTVFPGAPEACNGIDDDCDGAIDNGIQVQTWYTDADGDGLGAAGTGVDDCAAPIGTVGNDADCDDSTAAIGAETTFFVDADGDGSGTDAQTVVACVAPPGFDDDMDDCDDADPFVFPGQTESCNGIDDDCDSAIDEDSPVLTFYADADGDGFGDPGSPVQDCAAPPGTVSDATDCDDAVATTNPAASEACNGIDDDCDGQIDNDTVEQTWYLDSDGDGVGDSAISQVSCAPPADHVLASGDCDDTDPGQFPGNPELCDGLDQDCDGVIDEDAGDLTTVWADIDGDGWGDASQPLSACGPGPGLAAIPGDCDDNAFDVNPDATEVCNTPEAIDDDCDGLVDDDDPDLDGSTVPTWFLDLDGDGFGDDLLTIEACTPPSDPDGVYVGQGGDCDDADPDVFPGATEIPGNDVDEDCDGLLGTDTGDTGDTDIVDTDTDTDIVDTDEPDEALQVSRRSGCGCATSSPLASGGLVGIGLIAILAARRRREG